MQKEIANIWLSGFATSRVTSAIYFDTIFYLTYKDFIFQDFN